MLGSTVLFLLGYAPIPAIAKQICNILGIVFEGIDQVMKDAGAAYEYRCLAYYTRYVTVDSGSIQYSEANKSVVYKGNENASLDSTERAHIIAESKTVEYYPYEDYYNNGIFDAAYEAYIAAR